jgi:putative membrane protein
MANERTFLAWIRTNIGIMAFGFVIEKFGLFIKQMGLFLGKSNVQSLPPSHGYSSIIGILIVGFGILMNLMAYMNFKKVERQIEQRTKVYQPSGTIYSLLIITIIAVGIFLVMYLMQSGF